MSARFRTAVAASCVALATITLSGQIAPTLQDALDAIFDRHEFQAESVGPTAWLDGGRRYTAVRRSAPRDLIAYDTATGAEEVLVPASALVPPGATEPLAIGGYAWSDDKSKLLKVKIEEILGGHLASERPTQTI